MSNEFLNTHSDSAVHINPMSLANGLGINTPGHSSDSNEPGTISPAQMSNNQASVTDAIKANDQNMETNRRTMTQEQFDSIAHANDFVNNSSMITNAIIEQSPAQSSNSSFLNDYFPESSEFNLEHLMSPKSMGSNAQPNFSTDSAFSMGPSPSISRVPTASSGASPPTIGGASSGQGSVSDWSEHSNPAFNLAPAPHPVSDDSDISPRSNRVQPKPISNTWQPGTSVPVDFTAIDREFREAAIRSASQSASGIQAADGNAQYVEQPLAFPNDHAFPSTGMPETSHSLTNSINNLGLESSASPAPSQPSTVRAPSSSGSLAARRQRPRPMPLTGGSLRSTSYCGALPTAPANGSSGMGSSGSGSSLTPGLPTLRRIKSSLAMNGGIANGRIQKNIGIAQRSPMNLSFAEAMNSPKFARAASSAYSPAGTPLGRPGVKMHSHASSDTLRQWAQMQGGQPISRQPNISEAMESASAPMMDATSLGAGTFASPPSTPMYTAQLARNRFANGLGAEHTPPQSAPPTQQCFTNGAYPANAMQTPRAQMMHAQQQQTFVPMMANEYPMMPNVIVSSQPMQSPGQLVDLAQHYAAMGLMSNQQTPTQYNFVPTPYAQAYNQHSLTPPHHPYSMMPTSAGAPMLSPTGQMPMQMQQPQMKPAQNADFFVHEYSPPGELKRVVTPRKQQDTGPRNYTFANHGPEHFEKGKKGMDNSPPLSVEDA